MTQLPKTVVKWPGAKAQHVARMMRYPPPFEPRVIIDAFCGSAAFGLAAKQHFPDATLVLNDQNGELVNALLYIRDHADHLAEKLRLTPYSRGLFNQLRHDPPGTGFDGAFSWIIRNRQSVGGCLNHTGTGWSRDKEGKKLRQWARLPDDLRAMAAAICDAYIEQQDFEPLLLGSSRQTFGWDAEDSWTYLDPPYPGCAQYYGCAEDPELHERVARVANACRGAVMVSYADTPAFDAFSHLYAHWIATERFEAVQHMQVRSEGAGKGRRTELLLLNYSPGGQAVLPGLAATNGG